MSVSYPLVLLADNRDISQPAFQQAQKLRRKIAQAVENRAEYVAGRGLDPSFCLPAGNWGEDSGNDFLAVYQRVRDGGFDLLNRLRFWTGVFSGYNLMWLTHEHVRSLIWPIPPDYDQWITTNRAEPDEWVRLWVKFTQKIPPQLRFSPPAMLGEIGWCVDGVVVNHDTYVYQERINILHEAGIIDWLQGLGRAPRILEIGGGYGAVGFALRRILPSCAYMICDLPESLIFSGLYLTLCEQDDTWLVEPDDDMSNHVSKAGVKLLPNYMLHLLVDQGLHFDLVINTLSMSEMTAAQVHVYSTAIGRLIGETGTFFEQNQNNTHIGLIDCKDHIRGHFSWSHRLWPRSAAMTEGRVDLWANAKPPFAQDWTERQWADGLSDGTAQFRTRLEDLEQSLEERTIRLDALTKTIEERTARLLALEKALDERTQRLLSLEATIEQRTRRIVELEKYSVVIIPIACRRIWRRIRSAVGR